MRIRAGQLGKNGTPNMSALRTALLRLGFLAALLIVGQARATLFHVDVDTSSASGDAVMYFDLTDGGDLATVHHSVTISVFMSDGALAGPPGLDPPTADIRGTLPNPVSMFDTNDDPIITYFQTITLGASPSFISFNFEILGDPPTVGVEPDGFLFSLLDANFIPVLDTGVLFRFNIGAVDPCEELSEFVTCGPLPPVGGVPEPGALALAMMGLLALGVVRSARKFPLLG